MSATNGRALSQGESWEAIQGLIVAQEKLVDDLHEAGDAAAEAEADWKRARAIRVLELRTAKHRDTGARYTADEREAQALLDNDSLFRAYLATDRRYTTLREANRAYASMMAGWQTIEASMRDQVAPGGRR